MISRQAVKMAITNPSDVPTLSLLYKLNKITPALSGTKLPVTLNGPSKLPVPSSSLNDRIGLLRGDITTLAVDAIVNAANKYLLGGSGVDGAIHNAAGPLLLKECQRLGGCDTGSAKITDAYRLPCKKVIHAVGPIYDTLQSDLSESFLDGCYTKSLRLAVENGCKTVAFPSISTGVYGYPSREAAPVALGAVRKFLERDTANAIEKVVFVTFERKDVDAYNEYLPQYFPPVPEDDAFPSGGAPGSTGSEQTGKSKEAEAKDEAEAKAIADKLPSPPKY